MRAVDEVNKRLFSNETSLWNMWNKACIQFDPLSGLISLGSVQIQGKWWEGSPFLVAFRLLGVGGEQWMKYLLAMVVN